MKGQPLSERIYRKLLRILPFDFQREYGEEMTRVFKEQQRDTQPSGEKMGAFKLWSKTVLGILKTAPSEHLDVTRRDLRYALRALAAKPSFALIVVLTLALGIGANTSIFTIVNGVLLRPFPYPNLDRIVAVYEYNKSKGERLSTAFLDFQDLAQQNTTFERLGLFRLMNLNMSGGDQPERVSSTMASEALFEVAGMNPILGRFFSTEEDRAGAPATAVISKRLWQTHFGSDPSILGRTVDLNGNSHTIVGVMPDGMRIPSPLIDIWVPLGLYVDSLPRNRNVHPGLYVLGKLKPGGSLRTASAEVAAIADRIAKEHPDSSDGLDVRLTSYYELAVGSMRQPLLALLATVGLILLIACANIGSLMLARMDSRQREMAVRASLGASKWQIVRQLFTEGGLLSLAGGLCGVLVARWGVQALVAANPSSIPRLEQIHMDASVLAFAVAISLGAAVLFCLFPALRLLRTDHQKAIREGSAQGGGHGRNGLRAAFVTVEVALAVVVLMGAGLTIRSFERLMQVDTGFSAANVVTANVALPNSKYSTPEQWTEFYRQLIERIQTLPAAETIGLGSSLPLNGGAAETSILPEGRPLPKPGSHEPMTGSSFFTVNGDYFKAMGITLIRGRTFNAQDAADSPLVAVVDEKLANTFWPNQDPIGKRVAFELEGTSLTDVKIIWRQVVGVVRTVRFYNMESESPRVQIYVPFTQIPLYFRDSRPLMKLAVKTKTPPEVMVASIRRELSGIDKDLPLFGISTMSTIVSNQLEARRLPLWTMTLFSALALVLAVLGIYGVVSYTVAQRTHEIGIRMALGAQSRRVFGMVLLRSALMVGAGLFAGIVAGLGLTRFIRDLLFQVSPNDPLTIGGAASVLAIVALAASYIPARRAMRVDPLVALRYE
jgi:putative ABC transport system permease protein